MFELLEDLRGKRKIHVFYISSGVICITMHLFYYTNIVAHKTY